MVRMVEAMHQVVGSDLQEMDHEEDMDTQEADNVTSSTPDNDKQTDDEVKNDDEVMEQDTNNEEEDGSRSEATFRFVLNNFSRIKDSGSRLSEPHYIRNLPWKIMIMQRVDSGYNRVAPKTVGFFLQCNAESENYNWSCQATASLRLINHIEGKQPFVRKIQHCFYSKENDWGFSNFLPWADVLDPEKGYIRNDSVTFEVNVMADAPHGVSWDSKKHTGYVGLKNQGATCYMNSLLQTLFFTNRLRKAVYQLPTDGDDSSKSVALALQRVFYDLQSSDKPVGTKKLTKSFGWETLDSFMQHDVQEFLRVLLDNVESKMKGTSVEGTIPQLFEGHMTSYVNCKHIQVKSTRKEPFYDIQLNVKGKKNVYESFKDYISIETLDGDNKYDAGEDYGLQEAEKGVIFVDFPPVLHLHLMRFQYDPNTDSNVKINDRYEFPETLSLDDYKDSKIPKDEPATYTLHAVLVHSGDNHGGHYVVFINPKGDGRWCKFDDDVVSRCTKTEAIDHNFGGSEEEVTAMAKQCTNAYMLVYMQTAWLPKLLEDVTDDDVPFELAERLGEEKRLEAIRRRERSEAHLYMNVQVATEDLFNGHQGNDLFDNDKAKFLCFKMKKQNTVTEMLEIIADQMKYSVDNIRPWPFVMTRQRTFRPGCLNNEDGLQRTVHEAADGNNIWTIFLETAPPDNEPNGLPYFNKETHLLIFFKLYDPKKKKLHYCGHLFVDTRSKVDELIPLLNEKAGFPEDTRLLLFEEVKHNTLERITNVDAPIHKVVNDLNDGGNIIVFQKDDEDDISLDLPSAKDYFKDLYFRVEVTFCDKLVPTDVGFSMELSQRMNYDQMARAVASRLSISPSLLQFFKSNVYRDLPGNAIRCQFDGTLKDLLSTAKSRPSRKIYYQQLSIPIHELENKKAIKVTWLNSKTKEEKDLILYPNKTGTVADLLEEARQQIIGNLQEPVSGRLRLLEIMSYKIVAIQKDDVLLDNLVMTSQMPKAYRVEDVPEDQLNLADDEMLIPVAHYHKHLYQAYGVPFLFKVKQGEAFHMVKDRLQKYLDVADKEWEKYKFCRVSRGDGHMFLDDTVINISDFHRGGPSGNFPWLGLDHMNKTPKRARSSYLEKAIKIHN